MIRLLMDGKSSDQGVSSFQALAMSLQVVWVQAILWCVITAITFNWSWCIILDVDGSVLGCKLPHSLVPTLAQIYKERDDKGFLSVVQPIILKKHWGKMVRGVICDIGNRRLWFIVTWCTGQFDC